MAVYVDDYEGHFRGMIMCHMMSDTSLDELHAFATRLGLRRSWFQNGSAPHYDICKTKRRLAVQLGAIEVSTSDHEAWITVYRAAKKLKEHV